MYSNGLSEVILGKAIKKFNLPREELVIMTKVFLIICMLPHACVLTIVMAQVYFPVPAKPSDNIFEAGKKPEDFGIINQKGLNRKARIVMSDVYAQTHVFLTIVAYIRLCQG